MRRIVVPLAVIAIGTSVAVNPARAQESTIIASVAPSLSVAIQSDGQISTASSTVAVHITRQVTDGHIVVTIVPQ